ncbi:MAG: hypothetical protein IKM74_04735 [Bacteroidales bacterium]|nr:hypothetical protein [Bacteroidales bacterium]
MVTLSIFKTFFAATAVIGLAAYAFYRIGKKKTSDTPKNENPASKTIKSNPNTIQAQQAFLKNLNRLLPFFSGVSEIKIDTEGLTDAIITINDEDLIAFWKKMVNRPDLWLSQMAAWGVKPDLCQSFVAMEKHKAQYMTTDNSELVLGEKYTVTSACWILTTNEDGKIIKKVVKKGIVTKQ